MKNFINDQIELIRNEVKDKKVLSGSENHPFYIGKGIMI